MRYLLDEDLPYSIAEIGQGLGLDVVSVHGLGRRGFADAEQLEFAVREERVFVTRNRDDFIKLTRDTFQQGRPHCGVLIVPRSLPNQKPEAIAHALLAWTEAWRETHPGPGFLDFLCQKSPSSRENPSKEQS